MKKILFIASAIIILVFGSLQVFLMMWKPTGEAELRQRAAHFPALTLTTRAGIPLASGVGKPTIYVYFNSTCDHCQRQLQAMVRESARFEGARLVLLSAEETEVLFAFASTLNFPATTDATVVHCRAEEIAKAFGVLSLPQIFAYDREGNLKGLFSGETEPSQIVSAISR